MLRVDAVCAKGNHLAVACSIMNGPLWTGAVMSGQHDDEAKIPTVEVNSEHELSKEESKSKGPRFFHNMADTDAGIASLQVRSAASRASREMWCGCRRLVLHVSPHTCATVSQREDPRRCQRQR